MRLATFTLTAAALMWATNDADAQIGSTPKPPIAHFSGNSGSLDVTLGPALRHNSSKPQARRASGETSLLGKIGMNGTKVPAGGTTAAGGIPQPKSAAAGSGLGGVGSGGATQGQVTVTLQALLYGQSLSFDVPLERGVVEVVVLARRDLLLEFAGPRGRLMRHMLAASSAAQAQKVRFSVLQSGVYRLRLQSIRPGLVHPALRARDAEPIVIQVRKAGASAAQNSNIRSDVLRSDEFGYWTEIVDRPNPLDPKLRKEQSGGAQGGSNQTGGTGQMPGKGGASGKV